MPEEKVLPKDRIASSFKQLAAVSTDLSAAAKELGKSIDILELALKNLNLGVSAWYEIAGNEDEDGSYWSRDIGYTKIRYEWRIALRQVNGHRQVDDSHNEEIWAFSDAPRWMCVEAAAKLPDLFDTLIQRAVETTKKVSARIPETEELASTVQNIQAEMIEAAKASKKGRKLI
jgi:hypothetical protein